MDPERENMPTEYMNATDFRVTKTTKGKYADYSTSKWARKERALDENELAAIDTHGLHNLADFLPKRPGADEINAISEMFQASVDGELYDVERWGNFYKPYGVDVPATATQSTTAPAQAAPVAPAPAEAPAAPVAAPVEPVAEAAPVAPAAPAPVAPAAPVAEGEAKPSADDILNMIRNRT